MQKEKTSAITIDQYLAALSPEIQAALQRIRNLVKSMAPEAEERISYGIPILRLQRDLIGFASQKKHCSFYTMSPGLPEKLGDLLQDFKVSGTTIHFSPEKPLPEALIRKIISERLAEMPPKKGK